MPRMGYARVSAPDRDPGIGAAKRRGVYRGRRKRIDGGRIREPAARQVPKARIARDPCDGPEGGAPGRAGAALVPGPGRSGGWRPPECANGNRPVGQVAPAA